MLKICRWARNEKVIKFVIFLTDMKFLFHSPRRGVSHGGKHNHFLFLTVHLCYLIGLLARIN